MDNNSVWYQIKIPYAFFTRTKQIMHNAGRTPPKEKTTTKLQKYIFWIFLLTSVRSCSWCHWNYKTEQVSDYDCYLLKKHTIYLSTNFHTDHLGGVMLSMTALVELNQRQYNVVFSSSTKEVRQNNSLYNVFNCSNIPMCLLLFLQILF